jgi:hypothetical protein
MTTIEFPYLSGVCVANQIVGHSKANNAELKECAELREIRRRCIEAGSVGTEAPAAGIRFQIDGLPFPEGYILSLGIRLRRIDEHITPPLPDSEFDKFEAEALSGVRISTEVFVFLDHTGASDVCLADGEYQLRVKLCGPMYDSSVNEFGHSTEFSLGAIPPRVTIRGEWVVVTISAWSLTDIVLLEPKDLRSVDLATQRFRWKPVPGASSYTFDLGVEKANVFSWYGGWKTELPEFTPGTSDQIDPQIAAKYELGDSAEWHVSAYDERGKRIAHCLQGGRKLVVAGEFPKQ